MKGTQLPLDSGLIQQLAATQQNPKYHREGNVLAHTEMVLEKYLEHQDQFPLTESEHRILYWACILHDVGKPKVTQFVDGRWRSRGHERAGLPIARNILMQQPDISPEERRKILDLVRWHGIPLGWTLSGRPLSDLKLLATRTDLRLLGIFAWFDFLGRISDNHETTLKRLEKFVHEDVPRVHYEFGEHPKIQTTWSGWNLKAKNAAWNAIEMRRVDLLEKLLEATPPPPDRSMGKVYLTIGPPLSGKTHYLDQAYQDTFRVNLADFMLSGTVPEDAFTLDRKLVEFRHMLEIYLRRNGKVMIEGRNVDSQIRKKLNAALRKLPIEIHYLIFETSLEDLIKRNQASDTPLEENFIRDQYQRFSLVHPWEAHQTTFVAASEQ